MMWGKRLFSCMMAMIVVLTMVLSVPGLKMEAADSEITYAVTGGNITFDTSEKTITDCDESVTEAVIPDTIGGVPVVEVGVRAFGSCINLRSVELPDSVTVIESFAFDNCINLNSVKMPKNLENIESWAFWGCDNLNSIEIPDKTRKIGEEAFQNCAGLDSIEIPASVTSIGNSAFGYCSGLRSIKVDKDNTAYSSEDGVLFDKEKTTLICYPTGKKQIVYDIPKGVTKIEDTAFSTCTSLRGVGIPESVTEIDEYAFHMCDSLTDVYYGGSKEAWENIRIEDYNAALEIAVIHYNSTCPDDVPLPPLPSGNTTVTGDNTEENDMELTVGGDVEFEIPDDIPLIGGGEVSLDFGEIPVQFEREGNTFRLGVGVDSLEDLDENGWATFKKFIETQKKSYRKGCNTFLASKHGTASMGMKVKPDISFFAYAEGTITEAGVQSFGGKSFIEIKAKAEQQWQTTVVVVPVVVKFSGEAGVAVTTSLGLDLAHSSVYSSGKVDLTLPKLKLSGGVGVAYIADVSVYGSGKNVLTAEMEAPGNDAPKGKFTGTLSGELGVSATALCFSYEKALLEGDWKYYPYSSQKAKARLKNAPYSLPEESQWEIRRTGSSVWHGKMSSQKKSRAKAANADGKEATGESAVQILQPDIYASAKPILLQTDSGKKVLIYTADISGRTTGNHTAVVYSVYDEDNSSWSDPVPVDDDGTADFDAAAAVDGENVYIVWSDAKEIFTAEEAEPVTEEFMEKMAGACEITAARLDLAATEGQNAAIYPVTNNDYADLNPAVAVNNHVPYISWYENRNNDILEGTGTNIVRAAALDGENFITQASYEVDVPIQSVAIGSMGNDIMAAWECSSGTEEDLETVISVMNMQGTVTEVVSHSQNHSPSFARINEQNILLWYTEDADGTASLQYTDVPGGEIHTYLKEDAVITSDYNVIEGNDCELVVCASNKPGEDTDGSNLYAYVMRNGQISEPVTLTDVNGYAANPSGIWNGTDFEFLFTRTDAAFNDELGLETTTDLCISSVLPQSNLEMGAIEYTEEDMMPGDTAVLTVPVTNDGLEGTGTDGKVQILYETEVIGTAILNGKMEPGQTEQVEVTANLPDNLPKNAELTVQTISEAGGSSDAQQITAGGVELNLTVEQPDIDTFSVIVSNTSGYDTTASLSINNETEGTLKTINLGTITAGTQITQSFTRQELAALGSDTLEIEVTNGTQDLLPFNNTASVYVGEDTLKTLDHLVASKTKTEYKKGEVLNLNDLEIRAVYTDGSEAIVSDFTTNVSDINMTAPGEKELVITYE